MLVSLFWVVAFIDSSLRGRKLRITYGCCACLMSAAPLNSSPRSPRTTRLKRVQDVREEKFCRMSRLLAHVTILPWC
ncbi:hypothetical protein FA15DRAFT_384638 [Coprinopsis marcescibilis]|uniref:Secreted protein n=1 Tax=Coprinopsis marcescibilis TaxID=230819 RepID=A0A5C3KWS9_COPMA|nr:hypothetical protein FA15DRAFT_384638 [Coprinopsis marcescibilis]